MRAFNILLFLAVIFFSEMGMAGVLKPAIRVTSIANSSNKGDGYASFLLERSVRFFQVFISPVDGDKCSMAPTCSAYSRQAFHRHGAIRGVFLTFDRLLHEGDESQVSAVLFDGIRYRVKDPIENNTFWWTK